MQRGGGSLLTKLLSQAELEQLWAIPPAQEVQNQPTLSPFLQLFSSMGRDQFARHFSERECQPGEVICEEGEEGDALYLIRSGKVAVIKGAVPSPAVLGHRTAGEIIGEMALLENRPRSATVIALTPASLFHISREDFFDLLNGIPALGLEIMGSLSARLRESDQMVVRRSESARRLTTEKEQLLELQQLRQETADFIIHDLRNPISNIAASLKLLEMVLPAEVLTTNRELIEISRASCERLQNLVDGLLDVSRLEAGQEQINLAPVDLQEVIESVIYRIPPVYSDHIHLSVDLPKNFPKARADRDKIERVFMNLVDNALKYTPEGGLINISASQIDEKITVSIADNGIGVPPEDRERIFERFAQATVDKRRRRGFGLGLAYCKMTVQAHGGQIWVESGDQGIGSNFIFTLPVW